MKTPIETANRICRDAASEGRWFRKRIALPFMTIILISFLQVAQAGADTGNWKVEDRVTVETDDVSLADLVDEAPEKWETVALGKAPGPGKERTLRRAWILSRARSVKAQDFLILPDEVVLVRPGREISREEVERAVQDALNTRLDPIEGVHVVSVGLPGFVPLDDVAFSVHVPDGPLPSKTTVYIDVLSNEKIVGRAWARLEIFESSPVIRLTQQVKKGDVLLPEHLERDEGKDLANSVANLSDAVGKRLVRTLREGTPLKLSDIESMPLVEKGDAVKLVAIVGGITASTMGKTLESAALGEMIRVKNIDSGETLAGVLRSGKVVDVSPMR